MAEETEELEYQFLVKKVGHQIMMMPTDDETKPETLDDVYAAVCILKRNLEAQQAAAVTQQVMMQAAMEMQQHFEADGEKTNGGVIIPNNKNIR